MSSAPDWWYVVSGLFFIFGSLAFVATIGLLILVASLLRELMGKIDRLTTKLNQVATQTQGLVAEVKRLTSTAGGHASESLGNIAALTRRASDRSVWIAPTLALMGVVVRAIQSRRNSSVF